MAVYSHDPNCVSPKMTADDAPSPNVVSCSNFTAGYNPWLAFDQGVSGDPWYYSGTSAPQWIKLDFGEGNAVVANRYTMTANGNEYAYPGMPTAWTLEGSNNDSDWTVLDSRTAIASWSSGGGYGHMYSFYFPNATAFRYYRWTFTAKMAGPYGWQIDEIELINDTTNVGYSPSGGAASPIMTAADAPSPNVASHSASDTGYEGWRAMDGGLKYLWAYNSTATPQWLKIDFGEGIAAVVNEYNLTPHCNNTNYKGMPVIWKLQGSDNDTEWTDLDSQDVSSTIWKDNVKVSFEFANSVGYRYYRLYMTGIQGSPSAWQIAEWELIAPSEAGGNFWPVIVRLLDQQRN